MPPTEGDDRRGDPDFALSRALIDALLRDPTPEELEEAERELEAMRAAPEPRRTGVHLSVQPAVEVDPRVGRRPRPRSSPPDAQRT
jgi:hypothetical protein